MTTLAQDLQALLDAEARRANTHGLLLGVQSRDGGITFEGAAGAASPDQPFFMASITKMFTGAVVMQLVDEGRIQLDDPVAAHLPHLDLTGLHNRGGTDRTADLTLRHLLHQTSGLADFFEGGLLDEIIRGQDRAYGVEDVVRQVRGMTAVAAPNSGKSHYSDTNFVLLGAVLEAVTGTSLQALFTARIFEPVGMGDTFLFDHTTSHTHPAPVPLYYKAQRLEVPLALSSMPADGGGVWTLTDGLRFLRAYFRGDLFDPAHFAVMTQWNRIHFPFHYGLGLMRFKLPRWMNLFRETTEFIGHAGASGSWAFYAPQEDLFVVGSVNQLDARQRPFRLLPKVMQRVRRSGQA